MELLKMSSHLAASITYYTQLSIYASHKNYINIPVQKKNSISSLAFRLQFGVFPFLFQQTYKTNLNLNS